jgi:hypothetical protein
MKSEEGWKWSEQGLKVKQSGDKPQTAGINSCRIFDVLGLYPSSLAH